MTEHSAENDALELLAEWYDWWIETPGAPEKMPNALHVRTALLLVAADEEAHAAENDAPCPTCGSGETTAWLAQTLCEWHDAESGRLEGEPFPCAACMAQAEHVMEQARVIPPDGTDPDNPIIHDPGCGWETGPYCTCDKDPERTES